MFGQRPQDRPVLLGLALGIDRALAALNSALGIHVEPVFLGIGGGGKDDVRAMGARITMGAEIDDEGISLTKIELIGAQQEQQVGAAWAR